MQKTQAKLIIAGPGTGKTTRLLSEIENFINENKSSPSGFIACTFTTKAAEELALRLQRSVENKVLAKQSMLIGTIHSICLQLLRDHPSGNFADFEVLSEEQVAPFIYKRLHRLGFDKSAIGNAWEFSRDLGTIYSLISDQDIDFQNADFGIRDDLWLIGESYSTYLELLAKESFFDFALIQVKLRELLRTDISFREQINSKYRRIFVDEYQDTNPIQSEIFIQLGGTDLNLTVVGDDDQSIYGFRGAQQRHILEFPEVVRRLEKSLTTEKLSTNYRSTANIIKFNGDYINSLGLSRFEKNIIPATKNAGPKPVVASFETSYEEARTIANCIKELRKLGQIRSFADVAVLFRSVRFQSHDIQQALVAEDIPFTVIGSGDFFDREFAQEFMALIKFMLNRDINGALEFEEDLTLINPELIAKYTENTWLDRLIEIKDQVQEYKSCLGLTYALLSTIEFFDRYSEESTNLGSLTKLIFDFDKNSQAFDLYGLWGYLCFVRRAKLVDYHPISIEDRVQLLTVHRAKGLEFTAVFMPMQVALTPTSSIVEEFLKICDRQQTDDGEEYRVGYVGLTRAEKYLWISTASRNMNNKKLGPSSVFQALEKLENLYESRFSRTGLDAPYLEAPATETRSQGIRLSYNAINSYSFCPKYYKFRHLWQLETARTGGIQFGTNMHRIVQQVNEQISTGNDPKAIDLSALVEETYKNSLTDSATTRNRYKETALRQIQKYVNKFDEMYPNFRLISSEEQFDCLIGDVSINGRFDMVAEVNGDLVLTDFKTGDEADYSNQLSLYSLCYKEKHDALPKKLGVYYFQTGEFKVVEPMNEDAVVKEVTNVRDKIELQMFQPTPGKNCSSCSYKSICKDAV